MPTRVCLYCLVCLVMAWWGCVAGGCTSRSGAAAVPAGGPMAAEAVGYSFELEPGTPTVVRVTMRVQGTEGPSRLAIAPNWGGVQNCEQFVHGLTVRDGAGRECVVEADAAGHGWDVRHEPDAVLTASYELRPGEHDPLARFGTHYEPVVRDDLFQLIGETGLIYPEWLEDRGEIEIGLSWVGFAERGWSVVSSFPADTGPGVNSEGCAANKRTLHVPLRKFRHAMFMAGKVRVVDRQVRGGTLRVAVVGEDWEFVDAEMADLVARIVEAEREFVKDFGDPYFLVTVSPTGERARPDSVSMGGTGLTNCFALYLAPGSAVGPDSPHRKRVLHLLAHEYFHRWNGGDIGMEDPEELVYWFSEGFTDFYAARLLLRAGMIDDAAWLERTNEALEQFYLSPVATAPAAMIQKEFWSRREVQDLPYKRGEVVALCLDEEIRRVSGGRASLDDFFLEVLADARRGEKVNTERLLSRIAVWTSPEFAASLRKVVVDGALPDPPRKLTRPTAERVDRETYRWDPGFDLEASLKSRVATGVREGSAADKAGLRDGQKMEGFSVYRGDPEKEITLVVRVEGEKKEIRYWPRGEGVRVVGYKRE